ncbi:MAG TPA: FtsW/RodA/SpoVE family cell cycle protein [Terriglobales bacterium]|nr:FtsW/RodA/SpoVE family cell cycle protein [Terriglobales bacterium]
MVLTRSRAAERVTAPRYHKPARRGAELLWLTIFSAVIAVGLVLVYRAKANSFAETGLQLEAKRLLNLNDLASRNDLLPFLTVLPDGASRELAARKIYASAGSLPNTGAIATIEVTRTEVRRLRGAAELRKRFEATQRDSLPILTRDEFRVLKPFFVVRRPAVFTRNLLLWSIVFFVGFVLVHIWWRLRGFTGDRSLLPAVLLLSGIGLILMVSLRDPLRDTMIFIYFAQGVFGGCVLLALASVLDYDRLFSRFSFVPLLGSFALSVLLIVFGYGPGTSDAKVNLFGFQPVELIRLLLIFFLAGYFARNWEILRNVQETRPALARITRFVNLPRLEYALPAFVCVALSLIFFFLQKDLGPALVFACLFFALYAIARNGAFATVAGLATIVAGFAAGYAIGFPDRVAERVRMWVSPWDNVARGGDQLAQSLWAFATGGVFGSGLGLGDPQLVPAAHTDLVFSALGEEFGLLGFLVVAGLFVALVHRGLRIAERARTDYEFFLATGLTLSLALQVLFIAAGALGVLPLAGIVTPFLSYGRTALLANFVAVGILLAISARGGPSGRTQPFRLPIRAIGIVLACVGTLVVAKAMYVQLFVSTPMMGRGALVVQADGVRRFQYNPRFQQIMREIPMGDIYDRNGIPLATSNRDLLQKHRPDYEKLGINIDQACPKTDTRCYPFGGLMFTLLGDVRTRMRWGATNSSLQERDSATRLRGYDDRALIVEAQDPRTGKTERIVRYDYRELVPLLRHRNQPNHPAVRRVLDRPRDVHMSIDARLQIRTAAILLQQLQQAGKTKGAAVVLDSETGDLLASVSLPLPPSDVAGEIAADQAPDNPLLDRARYGLYPPGSTFKIVTAMASLRGNPESYRNTYACIRLPGGRVGNFVRGHGRPIRDDVRDHTPHGTIEMERAVTVSCNAWFAQLGTYQVGAENLFATASQLGISVAAPNTAAQLGRSLPQSSYGQGQVVATPFQMARVAATVANGGTMPFGRWVTDESNARTNAPQPVLPEASAAMIGRFMREVVTQGTGRRASGAPVPIAGKTGTAELANAPSHAWFIGYAPYGGTGVRGKIAFAVLIENGQYGGDFAAPAAAAIVSAAQDLGLLSGGTQLSTETHE